MCTQSNSRLVISPNVFPTVTRLVGVEIVYSLAAIMILAHNAILNVNISCFLMGANVERTPV